LKGLSIERAIEDNTIEGKEQMRDPAKNERAIDAIVKVGDAKYKK
jgi:hypothetical protein